MKRYWKSAGAVIAVGLLAGCATTTEWSSPLGSYRYHYDSRVVYQGTATPVIREPVVTYREPVVTYREPVVTYREPTILDRESTTVYRYRPAVTVYRADD